MRVLLYQRYPYYHFIRDFAADFTAAGHVTEWVPSTEGPRLREHVARFRPDFVFCVGASNATATLLAGRVPLVFYELDKILNHDLWNGVPVGENDAVFTTYRDDLALFQRFGFRHVHYLPFCPNLQRGAAVQLLARPEFGVAFVGSIVREHTNDYRTLLTQGRRLLAGRPEHLEVFEGLVRFLESVLAEQDRHFAVTEYRIPDRFHGELPAPVRQAMALFQLSPTALTGTLAKEAAHRHRLYWLSQIDPVDIWGPEAPGPALPGARYHGPAGQYRDCGPLFAAATANLNLQRIYARDGLSDRVFNVLEAGGCLLADANAALLELFAPGHEVETFASPEELRAKCERLAHDGPYRTRLAVNGQRCLRARHQFRHRLASMLRLLGFARPSLVSRAIATVDDAVPAPTGAAGSAPSKPSFATADQAECLPDKETRDSAR